MATLAEASRPTITFSHVDKHVVVLTAVGSPSIEQWPQFEHEFRNMYDAHSSFVLLFDLRKMGMPDMTTAIRLMNLVSEMKVHSFRQLIAAVILTSSVTLRDLIVSIVRKAGQAAPFYAFSDASAAVTTAAYLSCIERGVPGLTKPACMRNMARAQISSGALPSSAAGKRWRDIEDPSTTFAWIVLFTFARAFGHVMQWARRNGMIGSA
jgi:hypothetical protein